MSAVRLLAGVGVLLVLVAPASAEPPPLHTSATVSFTRLPSGHVPFPEAKPPLHIPAGETVAGFYLASPPPEQERYMKANHMGMSYLATSEAAAKAFGRYGDNEKNDTCLSDGADVVERRSMMGDDDAPLEWSTRNTEQLMFQFDTSPTPQPQSSGDVHPVHSERFVAGAEGHATLEVVDVWADARTHGVRPLNRYTLSLLRIFTAPNDLEVYGARDGETLEVVLHRSSASASSYVRDRLRSLVVMMPEQDMASSDCGHLRFSLRAPAGTGQMGTLWGTAFLPASAEELATLSDTTPGPQHDMEVFRMMRQRTFQLSISASSTAADPHPVVSISLGWFGHEHGSDF